MKSHVWASLVSSVLALTACSADNAADDSSLYEIQTGSSNYGVKSVTLFENGNFTGRKVEIPQGTHNLLTGFQFNDVASAIVIPPRYGVKICQHGNRAGTCRSYNSGSKELAVSYNGGDEFNDEASWISALPDDIQLSTYVFNVSYVRVFKDINFFGAYIELDIGTHNLQQGTYNFNDRVSSLVIPPKRIVTLCEHANGGGHCVKRQTKDKEEAISWIGRSFNDGVTFVKVEINPAAP